MQTLSWFNSKIGKKIFRDYYKCCATCDEIFENGLLVKSKEHAEVLYNTQNDFEAEGRVMNYRDKK